MQTTTPHLPPLAEYLDLDKVQQQLAHFATLDSFRWFVRNNRNRLAESGALILVAGRQKFHLDLTRQVVVEAGRAAALGNTDCNKSAFCGDHREQSDEANRLARDGFIKSMNGKQEP